MRGWKSIIGTSGMVVVLAGCGGGSSELTSEPLGKDTGIRYEEPRVPTVKGMTCDRVRGSLRYGLRARTADTLPKHQGKKDSEEYTCYGPERISLAVQGRTVAAPHIAAEYNLYAAVPDPLKTVKDVYTKSLAQQSERTLVGEATTVTTQTAALTCQQNVWNSHPMTTCLWANHGAVGAVDLFPPAGRHPDISEAVNRTKELIATGLVESPR
ncbi:hypothetical protein [Streptomyces sp. NPDC048606]|uniref:hypothetical protein n=1 Tax=Streptomyces sp. NPDC048606 TaxID=3154726 RepID=UPI003428E3BE